MLTENHSETDVVPLAYSPDAAAKASGRSRTRIYRAIGNRELTARKDGKRTLIERSELIRWIKAMPVMGEAAAA